SSRIPLCAHLIHTELQVAPTTLEQPETVVVEGSLCIGAATPPVRPPMPPLQPVPQPRPVPQQPAPGYQPTRPAPVGVGPGQQAPAQNRPISTPPAQRPISTPPAPQPTRPAPQPPRMAPPARPVPATPGTRSRRCSSRSWYWSRPWCCSSC